MANKIMATNTLAKPAAQQQGGVSYDVCGTKVKISLADVKRYLVTGNAEVSDQEALMFLATCRTRRLDPWVREAYLIKYSDKALAAIVISKAAYLRIAQSNPRYEGLESGVIVIDNGDIKQLTGTYYPESATLVGGWAKVYVQGWRVPREVTVSLAEYVQVRNDGKPNSQWTARPATMIEKVAIVHALRESFPQDLGNLHTQEERAETADIILDETPIDQEIGAAPQAPAPQITTAAPVTMAPQPEPQTAQAQPDSDMMAALFGGR